MKNYDLIIIGGGPGGYVAAIAAGQKGLKTALVEKRNTLGGTCLNIGCIPSKALLDSSHKYYELTAHAAETGFEVKDVKLDFTGMIERKDKVVADTSAGVNFLMKKNGVDVFNGTASFTGVNTISVAGEDLEAKNIIIASGSAPAELPFAPMDGKRIISSTEALSLKEVPRHLVVIGGGVIGVELGTVYKRLGSEVTIIEFADNLLGAMDEDLTKEMARLLRKQGFNLLLSHKVTSIENRGETVAVRAGGKNGEQTVEGDYALVSIGRKPYTESLALDKAGVQTNERGFVTVNSKLQTTNRNVYAIGDVTGGLMLAHKAEEEGVFAVETIMGEKPHIDYNLIPGVVYTNPEVAGCGKTSQQLRAEGKTFKTGSFPFRALGRARASDETDGFVKILCDDKTDEVLGIHIIGARAADLIFGCVTAMEFRASAEDLARMCFAHPSFAEAIKEAALAAGTGKSLHA